MRTSEAVFDQARGKVSWTELDPNDPKRPPRVVNGEFTGSVHDILSAIYFMRTQPLQVGKNFELPMSDSGQVYRVPVRVLEKKRLRTVLGRVDAILVEADLFGTRGMLEGSGKFFMWFTDDARRVPVSVKIKSEFGTFDIKLKKFKHSPGAPQYLTQQRLSEATWKKTIEKMRKFGANLTDEQSASLAAFAARYWNPDLPGRTWVAGPPPAGAL